MVDLLAQGLETHPTINIKYPIPSFQHNTIPIITNTPAYSNRQNTTQHNPFIIHTLNHFLCLILPTMFKVGGSILAGLMFPLLINKTGCYNFFFLISDIWQPQLNSSLLVNLIKISNEDPSIGPFPSDFLLSSNKPP